MIKPITRHLCTVLLSTACGAVYAASPQTSMVPMRDGVQLATDVYLPTEGDGPWGVVLMRTPYDKKSGKLWAAMTERGIALVAQDVRGRYASEGKAQPFADDGWGERQDGLDTYHWIKKQPWCNGRVVTHGGSAGALTQSLLASSGPKELAGQHLVVGTMSTYHECFYRNGVFRKSLVEGWLVAAQWPGHCLPEVRKHPLYDDFWRAQNLGERAEQVNWPVVIVGGWYDIFQQGTLDMFQAIQERGGPKARQNVHLIMGPWTHGVGGTRVGDLEFPENAKWNAQFPRFDKWAAKWLFDQPLGNDVPPVTYYTMGQLPAGDAPGNVWRTTSSWPPPSSAVDYHLTGDRGLQMANAPTTGELMYAYDPSKPVPTLGGPNLLIPAGSFDQREIESRDDVLGFTTEPLKKPVEVTGRLHATLYVATSAADTDFTAKLTDVYPDGRSMLLVDGICRLSLRDSLERRSEVTPGETYRIEVDLGSTSYIFNTGHRIRLAISSSNAPRFEPNTNTGSTEGDSEEAVTAQQTLYVGGERASALRLPVVAD